MNARLSLDRVVTEWLHHEASSAGSDRVLGAALVRVSSVRQERGRPAWGFVDRHTYAAIAIAAAAVLLFAIIGINLPRSDQASVGGLSPSPSPQPTSSPASLGAYPGGVWIWSGEHSVNVDGVPLSFSVTTSGWESMAPFYMAKDTYGSQGAEAIVLWTTLPDVLPAGAAFHGDYVMCRDLLGGSPGRSSLADVAERASTVAGTDLVDGPSDVTVGGRAAQHVTFFVTYSILKTEAVCSPGYFLSWDDPEGGAMWGNMMPGDTVRVWIVDVDGTLLFIEAATHWNADPDIDQEIQQIIDSIVFD
jgi:hypothetical protein